MNKTEKNINGGNKRRTKKLKKMNLGKVVAIEFGWWATSSNVKKYKKIIDNYICLLYTSPSPRD